MNFSKSETYKQPLTGPQFTSVS